jgi:hypothetical protein
MTVLAVLFFAASAVLGAVGVWRGILAQMKG